MGEALPNRVPVDAETRELSQGFRASDLLELPEPLSHVLHWMIRQQEPVSLAETEAFFNQEREQTASLLGELCERGFVRTIEIDGIAHYRVRLAPRRGRTLPSSLWEALDENNEQVREERP